MIAGMRSTRQARIGDTLYLPAEWTASSRKAPEPLEGYAPARQMLFASVYPVDTTELELLFDGFNKLCLNDSSISVHKDLSSSLGSGLRCGFLGYLHMEVVIQRLRDEFGVNVIITTPSVPYVIEYIGLEGKDNLRETISSVSDWPETSRGLRKTNFFVLEPVVRVTLVTPKEFYGPMVEVMNSCYTCF